VKFWSNLSLRIRLTLLFVGLLAILLSILGMIFYQDTRNLLVETTASHLRARAKPIIEHWLYGKSLLTSEKQKKQGYHELKEIAPFLARDLTSRNTVALVLNDREGVLASGKRLSEEPDTARPISRYVQLALKGRNEVTYITRKGDCPLLVILIPLRTSPGGGEIVGAVQLSASLKSIQKTLKRHGIMLMIVALATLLAGAFLGLLIVSSSLEGLKRMVTTCRAISDGDLDRRVSLPERRDEIGQLSKAFDGMVDRIGETMGAQRRFVANAAHELRSPLTALQGSLEVLLRGAQDDPAAAARLIQGMYREMTRLTHLCERLLDLSRLEGMVNLHKQPIALKDFFKEFLVQLRKVALNRDIDLISGPRVTILFDPDMLRQILFNLVQNAVQHTKSGGKITLGWRLVSKPEGVMLWVADDGEGILPEDLPRVFEPFYRGRTREARETWNGTGLGLNIVKAIIMAHNGDVKIESMPGRGTKVIIRISFE